MKRMIWLLCLGAFFLAGCNVTVNNNPTTTSTSAGTTTSTSGGTTTSTSADTTTSTSTTSTSTTATSSTSTTTTSTTTTTTSAYVIQGTILNYGGVSTEIYVYILPNWNDDPVTVETISTNSPINFSYHLNNVGRYYVVASDFDINQAPAAGRYIGGYNWTGTASVEAAGDAAAVLAALQANVPSIEVSGTVTAEVNMHRIIQPTAALSGNITWEWSLAPAEQRWGVPGVIVYNNPSFSNPLGYSIGQVIATGETATYSFNFSSLGNGTYYLLGVVWLATTEAGGDPGFIGEYSDGYYLSTPEAINFIGTPISGLNWPLIGP